VRALRVPVVPAWSGRGMVAIRRPLAARARVRGEWCWSPRALLVIGTLALAGVLALTLLRQWRLLGVLLGVVGGGAIAMWLSRDTIRRQRLELDRSGDLLERRAEQLAALSHELRTPLSMIKGATELLLEESPGPVTRVQEQFMRSISQQCNQVIRLCEGLLVQAKIETGLFTPAVEPTDMSGLVRDVVVAMRPLCVERKQQISLDTPQVVASIPVDPGLIVQALTNLLSNAIRFTSAGGRIDVRLAEVDDGMAVYVSDDGDGMTREQRATLFRRFSTGRPLTDGTGLGLVITKDIVELHGGSIMVDTTARRGTTFVLTLPARAPA
jgi:two-component system, OmpR family, sensor kinase